MSCNTVLSMSSVYTQCIHDSVHNIYLYEEGETQRESEGKRLSLHLFRSRFLSQLQSILISLVKGQYRPPVRVMYSRDQHDKR